MLSSNYKNIDLLSTEYKFAETVEEYKMQKKWWKESVVYQIYPRSFMDSNGDGIGDCSFALYPDIYHKLHSKLLSAGKNKEDTRKVSWHRS